MNHANFINLCRGNNNFIKIKSYYDKYRNNIDIHKDNNNIWKILCKKNKTDILKYIYDFTKYEDWIFNIDEENDIFLEEDLFCFLARNGYVEIGKYIYEKESIDIYQKYNEPLVLACQECHIDFIEWLYNIDKNIDIFSDEIVLNYCIYKKNIEVVIWYKNKLKDAKIDNIMKQNQIMYILEKLSGYGELGLVKDILNEYDINEYTLEKCLHNSTSEIKLYLLENYEFDKKVIEDEYNYIFQINDLRVIKKLDEISVKKKYDLIDYKNLFLFGVCNNNVKLCKYIYDTYCKNSVENSINNIIHVFNLSSDSFLYFVCNFSNLKNEGLCYLYNLLKLNHINISDDHKCSCLYHLCKINKLKEAKFIYDQIDEKELLKTINLATFESILYTSNIKIIEWILQICKLKKTYIFRECNYLLENTLLNIDKLSKRKQYSFLKYIIKYIKPSDFILNVIKLKNVELLKLLYISDRKCINNVDVLYDICNFGDIKCLQWYLKKKSIYTKEDLHTSFLLCCKNGDYECVKFLYDYYHIHNINRRRVMRYSYKSKNTRLIMWVNDTIWKNEKLILVKEWDTICLSNNYHLIRWILNNENVKVNIKAGFKIGLKNGNLDVIKLLYNYIDKNDIKNILYYYEGFLVKMCLKNKNIDILKYLDNYIDDILLRNIVDYKLIYNLFTYEKDEIIDYIYNKIDVSDLIRSHDDKIFRILCKSYNFKMIRYIQEKFDIYDYKKENNNILPIIMDSIEYYYENRNYEYIAKKYDMLICKKKEKLDECMICYENESEIITNCKHYYCKKCIFKWYIYNNKICPYCRTDIVLNNTQIKLV